ncbi:hypothetical protein KCV01_g27972, partial [Aureobasidium melanogenum]
ELKLAKDQIPSLEDRVKNLEEELKQERNARESAEERASLLESSKTTPEDQVGASGSKQQDQSGKGDESSRDSTPELQAQLDRLRAAMEDMKTQMEAYRRRAETAESQRDDAHQTLAEMVEQKRKENAEQQRKQETLPSPPSSFSNPSSPTTSSNGHIPEPLVEGSLYSLLAEAGINA